MIAAAWIFSGICVVATAAIAYKYIDAHAKIKREQVKITEQVQHKGKYASMAEYVDKIPMVLQEAIDMYNQMAANCTAQNMPKEQADKILEPLMKNIKRLEKLNNIRQGPFGEPALKIGASFADKGTEIIDKFLNKIGK